MSSDVERRARDLLLEEDGGNPDTSPYPESAYDARLRTAIAKIKAQDREQTQSQTDTEFHLSYLAQKRYELGEEIEAAAAHLTRLLREYEALHQKHADSLPSGTDVDLHDFLPTWFRHRFGRYDSALGVEMADIADISSQHVPLPERDPLAQQGHGLTVKGRTG